jgi:hypothetical protein
VWGIGQGDGRGNGTAAKGGEMSFIRCHKAPDPVAIAHNVSVEPEGERIRAELIDFLTRNKIVFILLPTEHHMVQIDIAKLPPEIKPVLTRWGSIFVRDEPEGAVAQTATPLEGKK